MNYHKATWLNYLNQLSNRHLGFEASFDQARQVLKRLNIHQPAPYVIVVTGTNGKGSVVAALEHLALNRGYHVGVTTSPHLEVYNERIRIAGEPVSDERLCQAFATVYQQQGHFCLNYFQFGFLAALVAFSKLSLDLVVLEVGVGGRLDACNLLDNQQTIITNIALDHCDKLGNTRDAIAREKADLIRPQSSVILGEKNLPHIIHEMAQKRGAQTYQIMYDYRLNDLGNDDSDWQFCGHAGHAIELSNCSHLWRQHAAIALQSWSILDPLAHQYLSKTVFQNFQLPARQELMYAYNRQWLLDVAHNPQAARALKDYIETLRYQITGRIIAIVAMRTDKAVHACITNLASQIDQWHVVEGSDSGLATSAYLHNTLEQIGLPCSCLGTMDTVIANILDKSEENDLIVTFGSFILVGSLRQHLRRDHYGTTA